MPSGLSCRSWSMTHPGTRRGHNQDALLDRPDLGLWVVADGAGGHSAGALASSAIVESLASLPPGLDRAAMLAAVRARVAAVHGDLINEASRSGPDKVIASTVVALCLRGRHYTALWAGDSRIYRLHRGELSRITHDHSLVQELVDLGHISAAEAEKHPNANVITRAVGSQDAAGLQLDSISGEWDDADLFLLCSDGLTKAVPEAALQALLAQGGEDAAQRLVDAALANQARDNVTAIVVRPCSGQSIPR